MLTPTWQMDVFIYETLVLMPVYVCILVDFVVSRRKHKCFRGPYYSLMVSQGLADVFTIGVFSSLILARYFSFGNLFLFSLSPFMPLFYANSGPFMFTMRIVGVFLISSQRWLTVCRPHGTLNYKLNNCPPLLLGIIHWSIGLLIYTPALLNSDAYFENEITLFIMTSGRHAQVFSITVISSFFTVGLSIVLMYTQIGIVMIRARSGSRMEGKRVQSVRLTLHVFVLVVFCIICFFYYIGEYVLSFDVDRSRLKAFRLYYPTVSGNFSFINPIMLLILNKEVQNRIANVFCCTRPNNNGVSIMMMNPKKSTVQI